MPKADIHYLYNQKVTNKKFIIYNWFRRMFYILKSLHYNFIINTTRNVFPYVYNQVVIHPLITHSISNRLFTIFITENDLSIVIVATSKFDNKLYIYIYLEKKFNEKIMAILQYSLFLWVWYPLNCYHQIWCSYHHMWW